MTQDSRSVVDSDVSSEIRSQVHESPVRQGPGPDLGPARRTREHTSQDDVYGLTARHCTV